MLIAASNSIFLVYLHHRINDGHQSAALYLTFCCAVSFQFLVLLLHLPRPLPSDAPGPSRSAQWAGRLLVVLSVLAIAGEAGYTAYRVVTAEERSSFDGWAAISVTAIWFLFEVRKLGFHLSGVRQPWDHLRGWNIPKTLPFLALTAFMAGYGYWVDKAVALIVHWVPDHAYAITDQWSSTAWLAVPAFLVAWLIWARLVVLATGPVLRAVETLLGPGNSISEAIVGLRERLSPPPARPDPPMAGDMFAEMNYERDLISWYLHSEGFTGGHRWVTQPDLRFLRPLVENTPEDFLDLRITYRAVAGHDELDIVALNRNGVEMQLELDESGVREELGRLREEEHARHAYAWRWTHIRANREIYFIAFPLRPGNPQWNQRPSRRQLADEEERFPCTRPRRRPFQEIRQFISMWV
ncbi:MAG TPA: hypothetical protein DEQ61_20890 [Streptomyces sp.]|nr:hypothetical protein [Streptomyces sp.]